MPLLTQKIGMISTPHFISQTAQIQLALNILCRTAHIKARGGDAMTGADWATWQPGSCQVGRLIRRPGGPLYVKC